MNPRLNVITIAVGDLERSLAFYRDGLGLPTFSLGYLVGSRDEVDELLGKAEAAGGTITDKPHDRPWGIYSGYFKDPDGHLWEIIWHPRMPVED